MKNWNERGLADLFRSYHDASQILEEKYKDINKADKWSVEFMNTLTAYSDICCALGDLFDVDPKEIAFD